MKQFKLNYGELAYFVVADGFFRKFKVVPYPALISKCKGDSFLAIDGEKTSYKYAKKFETRKKAEQFRARMKNWKQGILHQYRFIKKGRKWRIQTRKGRYIDKRGMQTDRYEEAIWFNRRSDLEDFYNTLVWKDI